MRTSPGQSEGRASGSSWLVRFVSPFGMVLRSRRLRGETFWVVLQKLVMFVMNFVVLKVFTNILGKETYSEWRLAMTGLQLLGSAALMPMQHTFLRVFHTAEEDRTLRPAGVFAFRWYGIASVCVLGLAIVLTYPLSLAFRLETLTILAAGCYLVCNRWRLLGVQSLDIQRKRRTCAMQSVGFQVGQVVFAATAMLIVGRYASVALFGIAAAAMLMAFFGVVPLARRVFSEPREGKRRMMPMVLTYGLPYGGLLICQWALNFTDRNILAYQYGKEAAAPYIAAFPVCGAPYILLFQFLLGLLVPIAYQRARDVNDPRQLWSADRLLLTGIIAYLVVGGLMLPAYAFFGPGLLLLLTRKGYNLSVGTMVLLASSRYLQMLTLLLQFLFAVHQKMGTSLVYRIIGAVMVVPACWLGAKWYGTAGAAAGSLLAATVCIALLCLGPGGCVHVVRRTRKLALRRRPDSTSDGQR